MLAAHTSKAFTHTQPSIRKVVAQITPQGVQIMITHEEPPGERSTLMLKRHDLNANGVLDPTELKLAKNSWVPYVMSGLEFEVIGERPAMQEPKVKLDSDKQGRIATAILLDYTLPTQKTRTLRIKVGARTSSGATQMTVQSKMGLTISSFDGTPVYGTSAGPWNMNPGDEHIIGAEHN